MNPTNPTDSPVPDQTTRKPKTVKREPKFKAHASRIQVKRRKARVLDRLTDEEREFLRENLIRLNCRYADAVELFAAKFSRRLTISTLQRFFVAESRPKAGTHDEITVHFSLRFTVPKGANIRFNTGDLTAE